MQKHSNNQGDKKSVKQRTKTVAKAFNREQQSYMHKYISCFFDCVPTQQVTTVHRPVRLPVSPFSLRSKPAPSLMQSGPYQPQFPRQLSNSESISMLIIVK